MNQKIKLLYVDDETINLQLFAINFKRRFEVITAKSGQEALETLRSHPGIAVVVSDMRMPGMNGMEFIEAARQEFSSIPYYILTGFEISEEIRQGITSGAIRNYFRKPFNLSELEATILEHLSEN